MKRNKNYWNHRVVTKLYKSDVTGDQRLFSVVEVYYKDDKPDSYTESKSLLKDSESISGLKWSHKKIKKAFKKPILDLDRWPLVWYKNDKGATFI